MYSFSLLRCLFFFIFLSFTVGQLNVTIDDSVVTGRTAIQYLPTERQWLNPSVSDLEARHNGTIHMTNADHTRIALFFTGTEIHYYGDTGPQYGAVSISVDGEYTTFDVVVATASTAQYQQLLWSRTGLTTGDHQVIISRNNSVSGYVSLDYFRVVSPSGTTISSQFGPGASVVPDGAILVDDYQAVEYSTGWQPLGSHNESISAWYTAFVQNTYHTTNITNATATFTFHGTAVWFFGDTNNDHGLVSIKVDTEQPTSVSLFSDITKSQQMIWNRTGLALGDHVVTFTNVQSASPRLTIDFLMYLPSDSNNSTHSTIPQNNLDVRPRIIGAVLGGVLGVAALSTGYFFYRRRNRARAERNSLDLDQGYESPIVERFTLWPPIQNELTPGYPVPLSRPPNRPRKAHVVGFATSSRVANNASASPEPSTTPSMSPSMSAGTSQGQLPPAYRQ